MVDARLVQRWPLVSLPVVRRAVPRRSSRRSMPQAFCWIWGVSLFFFCFFFLFFFGMSQVSLWRAVSHSACNGAGGVCGRGRPLICDVYICTCRLCCICT